MSRKTARLSFDQILETLRAHGLTFPHSRGAELPTGEQVRSRSDLVPSNDVNGGPAAFVEHPGILLRGEVARLLDRGYQKFIKTHQYELPATAASCMPSNIQRGADEADRRHSLYNQSLGTTSDLYEYDRCAAGKMRFQRQNGPGNWQGATSPLLANRRGVLPAWRMRSEG